MTRAPDFLIIGAMKSGTTVLKDMLRRHPDIAMPDNELHFFDEHYSKGYQWYKSHFKGRAEKCIGEKTPKYMADPVAMVHIAHLLPNVRLLILLRDPVIRYLSHRDHINGIRSANGKPPLDHEQFWNSRFGQDAMWRGMYVHQLEHIYSLFSDDQIHIMFTDGLRYDTTQCIKQCFQHIGVCEYSDTYTTKAERIPKNTQFADKLATLYEPYNEDLYELLGTDKILEWIGMPRANMRMKT